MSGLHFCASWLDWKNETLSSFSLNIQHVTHSRNKRHNLTIMTLTIKPRASTCISAKNIYVAEASIYKQYI